MGKDVDQGLLQFIPRGFDILPMFSRIGVIGSTWFSVSAQKRLSEDASRLKLHVEPLQVARYDDCQCL